MATAKKKTTKKKTKKKAVRKKAPKKPAPPASRSLKAPGKYLELTAKDYMALGPCYNVEAAEPALVGKKQQVSAIMTYDRFPLAHRVYAILKCLDESFRRRFHVRVAREILANVKEPFDEAIWDCLDVAEKAAKGEATQAELQVSRTHAMMIAKEVKELPTRTAILLAARACFFDGMSERGIFNDATKGIQLRILKEMLDEDQVCSPQCLKQHFDGLV